MITPISEINSQPTVFHNRRLTIEGVCRTTCEKPFPHFTVEDKTGTIICETMNGLPGVGAHIEVRGNFIVDVPANCTFTIPRLNETDRDYIGHNEACGYIGCQFADTMPVAA